MEKDRSTKIISIITMIIAVVGLTLGFASYTRSLDIFPKASVNLGDSNFSVKFSTVSDKVEVDTLTPTSIVGNAKGEAGIIQNDLTNPTISNLKATFYAPGESILYTFYAVNNGAYDAYLKKIKIANVEGNDSAVICTAKDESHAESVTEACKGIKITVDVADNLATATTLKTDNLENITDKKIAKTFSSTYNGQLVRVKLEYVDGSLVANGSFDVQFGNVSLEYSTQDF